jgi:hypothetical protein
MSYPYRGYTLRLRPMAVRMGFTGQLPSATPTQRTYQTAGASRCYTSTNVVDKGRGSGKS